MALDFRQDSASDRTLASTVSIANPSKWRRNSIVLFSPERPAQAEISAPVAPFHPQNHRGVEGAHNHSKVQCRGGAVEAAGAGEWGQA